MIRVGITGHQDLGDYSTQKWVEDQLYQKLKELKPKQAFSCLAVGADQLFAKTAIDLNIPITAVIPCKNYESTIKADKIEAYKNLLLKSSLKIEMPFQEPSEEAFFYAGKEVVNLTDCLLAVWNNKPAKGLGGTADVVAYAQTLGKKVFHINLINKTVKKL